MFDIPSNHKIDTCIVTKNTVLGIDPPTVIINQNKESNKKTERKSTKKSTETA